MIAYALGLWNKWSNYNLVAQEGKETRNMAYHIFGYELSKERETHGHIRCGELQ
jgi:hypothetical protein